MADLFPNSPRKPRIVRMHVIDAGHAEGKHLIHVQCKRCGQDGGWWTVDTVKEGKRGIACPKCNPAHVPG